MQIIKTYFTFLMSYVLTGGFTSINILKQNCIFSPLDPIYSKIQPSLGANCCESNDDTNGVRHVGKDDHKFLGSGDEGALEWHGMLKLLSCFECSNCSQL